MTSFGFTNSQIQNYYISSFIPFEISHKFWGMDGWDSIFMITTMIPAKN